MKRKFVIGVGHRARSGKDYFASIIKDYEISDVHILAFSDANYSEVSNTDRILILTDEDIGRKTRSYLCFSRTLDMDLRSAAKLIESIPEGERRPMLLKPSEDGKRVHVYDRFTPEEAPLIHNFMTSRGINTYSHMEEKDPAILQAWGQHRRANYGENYWVDILDKRMKAIVGLEYEGDGGDIEEDIPVVLITGVRFRNEVEYLKSIGGYYVEMIRLNEDGSRFVPNDRAADVSETELDGIEHTEDCAGVVECYSFTREEDDKLLMNPEIEAEFTSKCIDVFEKFRSDFLERIAREENCKVRKVS